MDESKSENVDKSNFSERYWEFHRDYVENRSIDA